MSTWCGGSKHQNMVSKSDDGEICSPEAGGKFGERKKITTVKYAGEARGMFGVCVVKNAMGQLEGKRLPPFNYTGQTVIATQKFAQLMAAEKRRVLPMKGIWSGGKGYTKFGVDEDAKVKEKINNSDKIVCVTDLMAHAVRVGNEAYKDTPFKDTWVVMHDGLSSWWEKGAQAYLRSLGFEHRQLGCLGDTNKGTRYHFKVVGDSPELCRGLDSHGFADFKRGINLAVGLTTRYEIGDPRRFNMGTPSEMWRTMERVWEIEPTSERIVEDILAYPMVLERIIAAKGCVVKDEFLRTGRRARRADDKGDCKHKPRAKQRKVTLRFPPIHPDCKGAYDEIIASAAKGNKRKRNVNEEPNAELLVIADQALRQAEDETLQERENRETEEDQ